MLSLASALASASASASAYSWSKLRSLDLSESRSLNGPRLKLLCDALASPTCRLESLRLRDCRLDWTGCAHLASALKANPHYLRELDLSVNWLQDAGVKKLCGFLEVPGCGLEILSLMCCSLSEVGCAALASAVTSNPHGLRELDVSYNWLQKSSVEKLTELVKDPRCRLTTLRWK